MTNKKLVIGIHDVTPEFKKEIEGIISELHGIGVNKFSLAVIPNYKERGQLEKDEKFVNYLKSLEKRGCEIIQHGYDHTRHGVEPNFFREYAGEISHLGGKGEFQRVKYSDAKDRIKKGLDIMEKLGFKPEGMVGGAWFISDDAKRAAFDERIKYVIKLNDVSYSDGIKIQTPTIAYEPNSKILGRMVTAYHNVIKPFIKREEVITIDIHPQDYRNKTLFDHIKRDINEAMGGRELATYKELHLKRSKTKGLEGKILIIVLGFSFSLFLLSWNIIGDVISNTNQKEINWLGGILFIISLVFLFSYIKKRKKYCFFLW